jgi:hypothetical protein
VVTSIAGAARTPTTAELALGIPQTLDVSAAAPDRFAQGKPISPD